MTTRRQTGTVVRPLSEKMWTNSTTLYDRQGKLLWATGFSHEKRKKQKKMSDDAATDGDLGASVLRNDVIWPDNVENDGQQKNAVGNWLQS